MDPLHALDVAGLVPALGAGDDGQLLALGLLVGGQHLADAGAVDADGLLGEEVLAGLDDRLDVQGPEARRRRQHHQVAAVDHLLVGVEADEAAVVGDVELVLAVLGVPNRVAAVPEAILEHVGQGVDLDVVGGARRLADVLGRARAAAAAADQADLDRVAARGVGVGQEAKAGRRRGRCLEKITTAGGAGGFGHGVILRGEEAGPSDLHDALGRGPRKANETTADKPRLLGAYTANVASGD